MRPRALAVGGTALLLLTGCAGRSGGTGVPSPTPVELPTAQELVDGAAQALRDAGSVRLVGTFVQSGKEMAGDLHLQDHDVVGTVAMDGAEMEIVLVDGDTFVRAAPSAWVSFGIPAQEAVWLEGQWLLMPAGTVPGLGVMTLDGVADELLLTDSPVEEEVGTGTVDGAEVLVVTQEDGGTLSVLSDGSGLPVRAETKAGATPGAMQLSRFGERVDITAPADFIDTTEPA